MKHLGSMDNLSQSEGPRLKAIGHTGLKAATVSAAASPSF